MQTTAVAQSSRRTCCGCLDLKTGSYLAAGYAITLSVLGLIGCILVFVVLLPTTEHQLEANPQLSELELTPHQKDDIVDAAMAIVKAIFAVVCVIYGLWLVFSVFLVVGVAKANQCSLLAWFIYTIVFTCIIGLGILGILFKAQTSFQSTQNIVGFVVSVATFFLNIYAIWCVGAHRRELVDNVQTCGNVYAGHNYKVFQNGV